MKQGKWIELQKIDWQDEDGKQRVRLPLPLPPHPPFPPVVLTLPSLSQIWELAARKTTAEGGIDAVAIAALLKHPKKPTSIPMYVPVSLGPPSLFPT